METGGPGAVMPPPSFSSQSSSSCHRKTPQTGFMWLGHICLCGNNVVCLTQLLASWQFLVLIMNNTPVNTFILHGASPVTPLEQILPKELPTYTVRAVFGWTAAPAINCFPQGLCQSARLPPFKGSGTRQRPHDKLGLHKASGTKQT